LVSEDQSMETRGKRIARVAGPVETHSPSSETPPVPTDAPSDIPLAPEAEPGVAAAPIAAAPIAAAPIAAARVAQRISPAVPALGTARDELADFGREAFAALDESRTALARALGALSEEVAGLARSGIDTAARTAIEMLSVKTVSDAVAVNAGFARASFDNWIGSSARFSELGAKLAAESSLPFLDRLGKGWIGFRRTS
jgi:hypothetical protein